LIQRQGWELNGKLSLAADRVDQRNVPSHRVAESDRVLLGKVKKHGWRVIASLGDLEHHGTRDEWADVAIQDGGPTIARHDVHQCAGVNLAQRSRLRRQRDTDCHMSG
jgi:hypothetical protein